MNDDTMVRQCAAVGLSLGVGINPPAWVNSNHMVAKRRQRIHRKTKKPLRVRFDTAIAAGGLTALGILALESIIGIAFW